MIVGVVICAFVAWVAFAYFDAVCVVFSGGVFVSGGFRYCDVC